MNDIWKELLGKNVLDLVLVFGVVVIGIILVLAMTLVFFKVARVEKIGLGGIECDPEDEKPAVRKPARKRTVK